MDDPRRTTDPPERVYTVVELAEWLRCSEGFVRREIARGHLRARQLGAVVRILQRDAEAYLTERLKTGPDPRRNPDRHGRRAGRRAVSK